MMPKIIIWIVGVFLACVFYWMVVVGVSTEQNKKGNEYGMDGLLKRYQHNDKAADSFFAIANHYWDKSDKTEKWIPKFLRP